ncbi:MAG: heavy metal translocating P-type ATPase [Alphaproteobacteria bacterium]|nr:heavy metal translocating P-type ATPase [Alphaproteobacteria bacterium]
MTKCLHCEANLDVNQQDFCCLGCEQAFNIINQNGFENYYKSRVLNPLETKLKPDSDINFNPQELVTFDEISKNYRLDLMIHGLHCGACVWLIENLLKKQNHIKQARVNLTQKTIQICWQGTIEDVHKIIKLVLDLGYKLFPIDLETIREFENRFDNTIFKALAVAGFGAGNIMLFSFALWFDTKLEISGATRKFLHLLSSLIALPVLIYSGRIFFISALQSIKARMPNMDIAISIAIFLASIVSLMQTFRGGEVIYFDSAVMLVFFLLIGRYLDLKARKKAFDIASRFSLIQTGFARLLYGSSSGFSNSLVPIKKLKKNDIILVASGEKIACDGVVIEGESKIDNSLITGESSPEKTSTNSQVFGGSINIESPIKVKITKTYAEGLLSQIISLINNIQYKKNIYIRIADQFSKYYTPAVHILAFITFCVWYFIAQSHWDYALMNATAVLIITCPCALALAIPITQTITIGNFLKHGIIFKNGDALEKINKIDCIVLDKTGTLTLGQPILKKVLKIANKQLLELDIEDQALVTKIASTLAQYSKHPLSQALSNASDQHFEVNKINEIKGEGIEGVINNKIAKLGSSEFCKINTKENLTKENLIFIEQAMNDCNSNLRCFLKFDDLEIIFLFGDSLKEGALDMINYFQKIDKKIILLSGDYENEVKKIAKTLNIKNFYWQKNPLQKAEILQQLRNQNISFAMVGDGLNDAPSLALSNVSISFSKAVDISQNIADIVISSSKLNPLIFIFKYSQKSLRVMKQNLALALIYNIIAVPFAMMGFVVPLLAAIAMSSSSLLVMINSLKMNSLKKI